MSNYYIEKILKGNSIVEFLNERGIYPDRTSGKRFFYKCPIHKGDTVPSFVVNDIGEKEYQTYKCFGCGSCYNIINLKMALDNLDKKEAIRYFLQNSDIEIDKSSAIDNIINSIIEKKESFEDDKDIIKTLLLMGYRCREFLTSFENKDIFEKFFKEIDNLIKYGDKDKINKFYNLLFEKKIFERLKNIADKEKEEEEIQAVKWRI